MAGFAGWTPVYDELLRRAYRDAGAPRIARVLGVSECRVRARAKELGLLRDSAEPWDRESVGTLVAMTRRGRSVRSCARVLRRTECAVVSKRLDLRSKGIL